MDRLCCTSLDCCTSQKEDEFIIDDNKFVGRGFRDSYKRFATMHQFPRSALETGNEEWIPVLIAALWPYASDAILKVCIREVTPIVNKSLERYPALGKLSFTKVSLGSVPPRVGPITCYRKSRQEGEAIQVDARVQFDGAIDVQMQCGPGGAIHAEITRATFDGIACFVCKPLMDEIPVVGGVQVFLLNEPDIELELGGFLKSMLTYVPMLKSIVQSAVNKAIKKTLVLPNRLYVRLTKELKVDLATLRQPPPEGVLCVSIISLEGIVTKRDKSLFGAGGSAKKVTLCLEFEVGDMTFRSGRSYSALDPRQQDSSTQTGYLFVYNLRQNVHVRLCDTGGATDEENADGSPAIGSPAKVGDRLAHATVMNVGTFLLEAGSNNGVISVSLKPVARSGGSALERGCDARVEVQAAWYRLGKPFEEPGKTDKPQQKGSSEDPRGKCHRDCTLDKVVTWFGSSFSPRPVKALSQACESLFRVDSFQRGGGKPPLVLSLKLHEGFSQSSEEDTHELKGSAIRITVEGRTIITRQCYVSDEARAAGQQTVHTQQEMVARLGKKGMKTRDIAEILETEASQVRALRDQRRPLEWHCAYYLFIHEPTAEVTFELLPPDELGAVDATKVVARASCAINTITPFLDRPTRTALQMDNVVEPQSSAWSGASHKAKKRQGLDLALDVELVCRTSMATPLDSSDWGHEEGAHSRHLLPDNPISGLAYSRSGDQLMPSEPGQSSRTI